MDEAIRPKFIEERDRRRQRFLEKTTKKAIEEVSSLLKAANASERRLMGNLSISFIYFIISIDCFVKTTIICKYIGQSRT
jgi:hypothetical protein